MKFHCIEGAVPALLVLIVVLLFAAATHAEPWVGPGDIALRHDLQQLADAGVLHAPTMSWPLPWSDIKQDVGAADSSKLSPRLQSALGRVQKRAAAETATGDVDLLVEVAGTTDPWALRSFEDSPREEGEFAGKSIVEALGAILPSRPAGSGSDSPGSSRPDLLPVPTTARSSARMVPTSQ